VAGTEFGGEVELGLLDVDSDDGAAHDVGILHREVTEAADPEHANRLVGHNVSDLERFIRRQAGAAERGGLHGTDAIRHRNHILRTGDCILRERSIDRIATVLLLLAESLATVDAVSTLAAGVTEPGDRDALADSSVSDLGTEFLDDADTFMAGNERQCRLHRPVAVSGVNVGVTETAGLHPNEYLPECRLGDLPLLDLERSVERGDYCCLHGGSLVSCS
jgi:hypothetical protein